jgi:hypothetical protein
MCIACYVAAIAEETLGYIEVPLRLIVFVRTVLYCSVIFSFAVYLTTLAH